MTPPDPLDLPDEGDAAPAAPSDALVFMTPQELAAVFAHLGLSQLEVASILGVTARSVRGWTQEGGTPVPRSVALALHAMLRLHSAGIWWLPGRPQTGAFELHDQHDRLAVLRRRVVDLDIAGTLHRVRQRGGPVAPWDVNLARGRATLGTMSLVFHKLPAGGFLPLSYTRTDRPAEFARDTPLLEDGLACIARALQDAGERPLPRPGLTRAKRRGADLLLWDSASPPEFVVLVAFDAVREALGVSWREEEIVTWVNFRRFALAERATRTTAWVFSENQNHLGLGEIRLGVDDLRALTPPHGVNELAEAA